MGLHADEQIGKVVDRVDTVRLAGRDERVEAGQVLAGLVGSDEEEVLAAEGGDAERPLRGVVVDGQVRVGEEQRQRVPLAERVADGLAHWAFRRVADLLGVEPRLELVHHGPAQGLPHLEMLGSAEEVGVERGALDLVDLEDEVHRLLCRLGRGGLRVEELATDVRLIPSPK